MSWTSPQRRERVAGVRLRHPCRERIADDAECHDVGPLGDAATAELADRRDRRQSALDGKGWRPAAADEGRAVALPEHCRRSVAIAPSSHTRFDAYRGAGGLRWVASDKL